MKLSKVSYESISLDELVTFAVFRLLEEEKEATFENIVARCFELFPAKFSLVGHPHWPDSARVNKSWLRCRTDFGYLKGSVKTGFKITPCGLDVVEKVQRKIGSSAFQRHKLKKRAAEERTREEKFINQVEKSEAFIKFNKSNGSLKLSEFELCDILFCTLESPNKIRHGNLKLLREYAKRLERQDISQFLDHCEKNYSNWIFENSNHKRLNKSHHDFSRRQRSK